jgi:SAM-dependent methyltransferase
MKRILTRIWSINPLDLYAKIEPMIGFYDEYEKLYEKYLDLLSCLEVSVILDVGCGNGKLLKLLELNHFESYGIDRSEKMISLARKLGVNADVIELDELEIDSFDCALAVADVLNYIRSDDLSEFFSKLSNVLKPNGYFLADINTTAGFELADGVIVRDENDEFLSIESFFEKEILTTNLTLFEKNDGFFKKYSGQILQYYHNQQTFKNIKNFKLIETFPIDLFGSGTEKLLMVFQKTLDS